MSDPHILKTMIKNTLQLFCLEPRKVRLALLKWSLRACLRQNGWGSLMHRLEQIVPDVSQQETTESRNFDKYVELKRRILQTFQCQMMQDLLASFPQDKKLTVVDIGDSAGTHMLYLRSLVSQGRDIETISVNLDPRAIEKITAHGLKAVLCRAEELDLGSREISFFTSFQMLEHLHNPAIFLHRLAKRPGREKFLITVPYLKRSRVGLHAIRDRILEDRFAEDEHVFELSPPDWKLLMLHAGWRVVREKIYYQYPRGLGPISWLLARIWCDNDFEGFWGVVLEKDLTYSDRYKDWDGEKNPAVSVTTAREN